ncbi:MAG: tetratricopeptide repeat protein [Pseudanabaenaceae cyanobacterium]
MTDLVDLPDPENTTDLNEDSYDDLIVSIEAGMGKLSLLIAVCDDVNFRNEIINRYETELQPDIRPYRVTLDRKEPSLRAAVARIIQSDTYLQENNPAIITVTGTEELYFLRLGQERSEQEIFFGYLQWTREALREFHYPIVLWVNKQVLNSLVKQAPDFWSWRKGVFVFISPNRVIEESSFNVQFHQDSVLLSNELGQNSQDSQQTFKLDDLITVIHQTETNGTAKAYASLWVLYDMVGAIYVQRFTGTNSKNYKTEQDLAIKYFQKSINLQRELNLKINLDSSLANLGSLYESQGKYEEAKLLYIEALDILQEQGNYTDAISRLNDLARIHHAQGQYEEALKLYQQALEIYEDGKDTDIATYARTINLLAGTYHAQGKYIEAEKSYQKSLNIRLKEFGESHPDIAVSLNNLGLLYAEQGKFSEAESYYQQALAIQIQLLGKTSADVATSLNNIALLYYHQGRFTEAETYLVKTLKIRQTVFGNDHPDVAGSLNNLAGLYKTQGRLIEAEALYEQSLTIAMTSLSADHPITIRFQENLEKLREQINSSKTV